MLCPNPIIRHASAPHQALDSGRRLEVGAPQSGSLPFAVSEEAESPWPLDVIVDPEAPPELQMAANGRSRSGVLSKLDAIRSKYGHNSADKPAKQGSKKYAS